MESRASTGPLFASCSLCSLLFKTPSLPLSPSCQFRMSRHYKTDDQRRTRRMLNERGIEPGKGMGQNFLTDRNIAAWIVDQLDIQPQDTVIEIGPGMGALTE